MFVTLRTLLKEITTLTSPLIRIIFHSDVTSAQMYLEILLDLEKLLVQVETDLNEIVVLSSCQPRLSLFKLFCVWIYPFPETQNSVNTIHTTPHHQQNLHGYLDR